MTADARLLPAGIADTRSRAILELIERQGAIDLEPLLVNRIASASGQTLLHLAYQYHVQGLEGFDLAGTDEQRRQILRNAIELHRYKGTPWAVRTALGSAGYADIAIDEKVGARRHNGRFRRNGEITYSGEGAGWAAFGVVINDLADDRAVTAEEATLLTGIINEFKNARSRLQKLAFDQSVDETLSMDESASVAFYAYPLADGSYLADGSITGGGVFGGREVLA